MWRVSEPTTRRQFLVLAALVSGGGLLAACASQAAPSTSPTAAPKPAAGAGQAVPNTHPTIAALYEAAKKEGKLSWWDSHDAAQVQKFTDAFNKHFPNIQIEYFQATEDVTKTRAVQEARAGRVTFALENSGQNWLAYQDAGIVDAKTNFTNLLLLAGVEPQFIVDGTCAPEFNVYGSAYNTDMVKSSELPDTLDGFADAKWKDQIAVEARLRPYVYGTPFLGGEDKVLEMLARLKANNPRPTDGDIKSQKIGRA